MDIADWNEPALRDLLCSADLFNDCAIALEESFLNTFDSRFKAWLCFVTFPDHFLDVVLLFMGNSTFQNCAKSRSEQGGFQPVISNGVSFDRRENDTKREICK